MVQPEMETERIDKRVKRILDASNVVFAVSEALANDIRSINPNVYIVSHGVDAEGFELSGGMRDRAAKQLEKLNTPILYYMGLIHHKVDFNLLAEIAERKKGWSIVLLGREWLHPGPDLDDFKALTKKNNVFYLGEINRNLIPNYLKYADVCLLPLKKNEFNRYSAPLKIWQYLAAGKPIVAIDQGVKFDCDEYILKAGNNDEYIRLLEQAVITTNDKELAEQRISVASRNSWAKRVDQMMEIIEAHDRFERD
jgi:glycosyltransferase involved in cell wall biosynthesis